MSRVGRMPIPIPDGVQVDIKGSTVKVKGPRGELEETFSPELTIAIVDGQILVSRPSDQRHHRALHGLTRALINNMVMGVHQGFSKTLDIYGVGYRALLRGDNLVLQLGHSHAVEVVAPPGVSFTVIPGDRANRELVGSVTVEGIDKQVVGQVAADIRAWRPPEPYKGKGVRYRGEHVRRKAGKTGKV
ncbi:MAG: 50S ribosomal protein L6 [Anaerolineae bacterium]|nr:50S ribosomal protein L6 [Anaerolineae bacterium]